MNELSPRSSHKEHREDHPDSNHICDCRKWAEIHSLQRGSSEARIVAEYIWDTISIALCLLTLD